MTFPFLSLGSKPTRRRPFAPLMPVDVNAHLLPGRHDGTDSVEHSISLLREWSASGVRKIIASLHIMSSYYDNTADTIRASASLLNYHLQRDHIPIEVEPAAEYYIDRGFMGMLYRQEELLTFFDNQYRRYLFFETGLIAPPNQLEDAIDAIRHQGIRPVMAHPTSCVYLQKDPDRLLAMHEQGVLFQIDLLSLAGQPSREARTLAEWMIDQGLVSFIGSSLNQDYQIPFLLHALNLPSYRKAVERGLLNKAFV